MTEETKEHIKFNICVFLCAALGGLLGSICGCCATFKYIKYEYLFHSIMPLAKQFEFRREFNYDMPQKFQEKFKKPFELEKEFIEEDDYILIPKKMLDAIKAKEKSSRIHHHKRNFS